MPIRFAAIAIRLTPVLLFAPLLLSGSAAFAAEAPREDPKPGWRSGPVRYILTPDEDKAYKALKTDEDRNKAIEQFWTRRDPTPGAPPNEYREDFYKRLEEANSRFKEGVGQGWAADRGKILLTAGSPDSRTGEGEEKEAWVYSRLFPPSPKEKEPPKSSSTYRITFEKNESGEYKMSPEGEELLNRIHELDPLVAARFSLPQGAVAVKSAAAPPTPPREAPKGPEAPAEPEAVVPEGVERLRQAVLANELKNEIGMTGQARFFKAEDGSTRTVVMIAVKKPEVAGPPGGKADVMLYARLTPKDAPDAKPIEFLAQDLFTVYDDAQEDCLKYAFSWPLKRKSYELRAALSNGTSGKIGTKVETLTLPDFKGDALALSSVTLARVAIPAGAEASKEDPFIVGKLRLIPWVAPVLGPKDDLAFFYDVYNAKRDPATNQPSLDVTYIFEKKEAGAWKKKARVAEPDKHEETLGYTVLAADLAPFPPGDWRVTIQVKDNVAKAEVSSGVGFSINR